MIQVSDDDQMTWKDYGISDNGLFLITNVKVGKTYYVRLKTAYVNGLTFDYVTQSIATTGKDDPPSDVTGFKVFQSGSDLHALIPNLKYFLMLRPAVLQKHFQNTQLPFSFLLVSLYPFNYRTKQVINIYFPYENLTKL
jgi:hypothetical protein